VWIFWIWIIPWCIRIANPSPCSPSSSSANPLVTHSKYAKELTDWLSALGPPPPAAFSFDDHPCQHYQHILQSPVGAAPPQPLALPPMPYLVPLNKRNSELINSLLTLPKQVNEVGK
jgi:hypothetical protein